MKAACCLMNSCTVQASGMADAGERLGAGMQRASVHGEGCSRSWQSSVWQPVRLCRLPCCMRGSILAWLALLAVAAREPVAASLGMVSVIGAPRTSGPWLYE